MQAHMSDNDSRINQIDPPLTETLFPVEQQRDVLIQRLAGLSCQECQPKRDQLAQTFAFFAGRLTALKAVALIEERVPCTHLDDF